MRILALLATAATALVVGRFAFDAPTLTALLTKAGVWIMAAWFAAWLLAGGWMWRNRTPGQHAADRPRVSISSLALIACASGFLLTREPFGFKVAMDEYVLASTAMNMHFERLASGVIRGYEIHGFFQGVEAAIDKRPLFFPWLTSLVHDISGYRVANVFVLNAALTVGLLGLVHRAGQWLHDDRGAKVAVLLLVGLPLLAQNATGGGFEILNLVMLLVALLAGMIYVRTPAAATQCFFLFSVVLLACTRYESALFAASAGVVIIGEWSIRRRVFISWGLIAVPFMFVPCLWHLRVFAAGTADWWQLPEGASAPFSLSHLSGNIGHMVAYFVDLRGSSSPVLALGSLVGIGLSLAFLLRYWLRAPGSRPELLVWFAFLAGVLGNVVVLLCYHWGQVNEPVVSRLLLPFFCFGALSVSFALGQVRGRRWVSWGVMAAAGMAIYAFSVPVSARAIQTHVNYQTRRMDWCWEFHQSQPPGLYLFLTNTHQIFTLNRVPSLSLNVAEAAAGRLKFHLDRQTFNSIYVVQNFLVDPETGRERLLPGNDVGAAYVLETVAQREFRPFVLTRISRVVSIDPAKAIPGQSGREDVLPVGEEMREDKATLTELWKRTLP